MKKQKISIAYSPDTDDAFMMYALEKNLIDHGPFELSFYRDDIQKLNILAKQNKFDVTAISMACYPAIKEHYKILPYGSSIGDGFGPAIVVSEFSPIDSIEELEGKTVAIPGDNTSAGFAVKYLLNSIQTVSMPFDKIAAAVHEKRVDCGVLIHELQVVAEKNKLKKIGDLAKIWHAKTGTPLPLGGNAISRSLDPEAETLVAELIKNSIVYALNHFEEALDWASENSKKSFDLNREQEVFYIQKYVEAHGLELNLEVQKALRIMFDQFGLNGDEIQNAFYLDSTLNH